MMTTFLRVWDRGEQAVDLMVDDEPRVSAAVQRWVDSGRTVDTIIDATARTGSPYFLLASEVRSWLISSPESRQRSYEIDAADNAERAAQKQAAGLWEEES